MVVILDPSFQGSFVGDRSIGSQASIFKLGLEIGLKRTTALVCPSFSKTAASLLSPPVSKAHILSQLGKHPVKGLDDIGICDTKPENNNFILKKEQNVKHSTYKLFYLSVYLGKHDTSGFVGPVVV